MREWISNSQKVSRSSLALEAKQLAAILISFYSFWFSIRMLEAISGIEGLPGGQSNLRNFCWAEPPVCFLCTAVQQLKIGNMRCITSVFSSGRQFDTQEEPKHTKLNSFQPFEPLLFFFRSKLSRAPNPEFQVLRCTSICLVRIVLIERCQGTENGKFRSANRNLLGMSLNSTEA